ncbi:MAG: hypothetical protein WBC21_01620 [Minisyncoccales bacterium]
MNNKRLFILPVMVAVVGIALISIAAAASIGLAEPALSVVAVVAGIAVIGIAMTIVLRWTMTRLKKAGPWPHIANSVSALVMLATILAKTVRYPIYKSEVKTSPRTLVQCCGTPRNF